MSTLFDRGLRREALHVSPKKQQELCFSMQQASIAQAADRCLPHCRARNCQDWGGVLPAARQRDKLCRAPYGPRVIAMLRKKSAQEALLLSPENSSLHVQSSYDSTGSTEDDSYVELRLTASCGGVLGRVKVLEDASFSFLPHEVQCVGRPTLYVGLQHSSET